MPPTVRKKRSDENDEESGEGADAVNTMNFTVITKRGGKQVWRFVISFATAYERGFVDAPDCCAV